MSVKKELNEMLEAIGVKKKQQPQIQRPLNPNFKGVYRATENGLIEVYCPRCSSWDCSHTQITTTVPQKSKTRYTVNLNPLRPFTLVNKKEKIKQQGGTYSQHRFICNRCGLIFW
jgi:hypothetical protein